MTPAVVPTQTQTEARFVFGEQNRIRLLTEYFSQAGPIKPGSAWLHVYRLLLWIDRTTGLAHCYESDKCQPGRPWYARSLAFHVWVSEELGVRPDELDEHIDYLFRNVTSELAQASIARQAEMRSAAISQRRPYEGLDLPEPGEDSVLESIVTQLLEPYLSQAPSRSTLRSLTEEVQAHLRLENKRKNLLGEGFEDTVATILRLSPNVAQSYYIHVRPRLDALPEFRPAINGSKTRQVDVALVHRVSGRRKMISCKWSVRSDREEQFVSDFQDYTELDRSVSGFDYVLVTNEFDPARLAAACEVQRQGRPLFTTVVHVNPEGPRVAQSAFTSQSGKRATGGSRMNQHIDSRRLCSLDAWIQEI